MGVSRSLKKVGQNFAAVSNFSIITIQNKTKGRKGTTVRQKGEARYHPLHTRQGKRNLTHRICLC